MKKKELDKPILILNIIIITILICSVAHLILNSVVKKDMTEKPDYAEEDEQTPQEEIIPQEDEKKDDIKKEDIENRDLEGKDSEDNTEQKVTEQTNTTKEEKPANIPPHTLSLIGFDYEIINDDLVRVKSLSYRVENNGLVSISLEIFIHIYDEDDDDSKKGFVRDQIHIGKLNYKQFIEDTAAVSAYYEGDISTEKTLKIVLIGYLEDTSYNLASVTRNVIFT